ncbi:MAG: class I SAM-dependent methyltransferase, partial [Marinovum sp.]|nr:class I SAM-dependent methyltransferase [Marinovum sp.]
KLKFNTSTDFIVGDAMSLPYDDNSFDVALMALVLFFVPKPATGVGEMTRITKAGGVIAAYAWDVFGGGLPMEPLHSILRERGIKYPLPPSKEASQLNVMQQLWEDAGLEATETTTFQVERTFADFDDYWSVNSVGPSVAGVLKNLTPSTLEEIKRDLRKVLKRDDTNRIVSVASANAVKGAKG